MDKKEKIKKYYNNLGIKVDENSINVILKDKERANKIIRMYHQEEIEKLNSVLGKAKNNMWFTQKELEFINMEVNV